MPGGLAERAVITALHQGEPAGRVVADGGDLLIGPGRSRNPRLHTDRIACSPAVTSAEGAVMGGRYFEVLQLIKTAVEAASR
jgi:hypothetical protein